MRKIFKCLGEVAALAEVKAEAAGSPKQPKKPAETPRDEGGKRKRTPTPSTPTPAKRPKPQGGGRGGRGKR